MVEGHIDYPSGNKHAMVAAEAVTGGSMLAATVPALADAIVFFWLFPSLDIWASQLFYSGNHAFIGSHSAALNLARATFNAAFVLACLMAAAGVIIASISRRGWLTLPFYKWLFLTVCLSIGPGIVVDLGLKDHWGRARPYDVVEFGGSKTFSSPIHPSDQCESHCSFVSGEASSIFTIFFAAALMFRTHGRTLIVLGLILGSATGFVRMAQGAEFFSDVVFAGVLMALTVSIIQLAFDWMMSVSHSIRHSD